MVSFPIANKLVQRRPARSESDEAGQFVGKRVGCAGVAAEAPHVVHLGTNTSGRCPPARSELSERNGQLRTTVVASSPCMAKKTLLHILLSLHKFLPGAICLAVLMQLRYVLY
jgi:hypothetical protein